MFPACRAGFLCNAGQCVEACNPPCGAGTTCSAAATCEPDAPAEAADGGAERDGGYAIGAGVLGIVMAALTVGLHVVSDVGVNNYWVDIGLGWGGIGLPFLTAPIIGGGALSASGPGVTGIVPLRVGAWIAYGLYVIGAVGGAIYAADHSGAVPEELMITLAVAGVTTELAFAVDAIYTGAQANEPVAAVPVASLVTSPNGVTGAMLGALGRY